MASITNSSGRRTIQFVGADGKRRSIRLGKMDGRSALGVELHVDHLVQSKFSGMPLHIDTAGWLGNLDDTLHGRLSKVGLCQPRLVGHRRPHGPGDHGRVAGEGDRGEGGEGGRRCT